MSNSLAKVIAEISDEIQGTNLEGYSEFLSTINKDGSKIVCTGAGRVGLAMRGFAMRLNHLGIDARANGVVVTGDQLEVWTAAALTNRFLGSSFGSSIRQRW